MQWAKTTYCLTVHGGGPIVLCIFSDPLEPRINCLVIRSKQYIPRATFSYNKIESLTS